MKAKLLKSYKWSLTIADKLSKQKNLDFAEVRTILEYLGECSFIVKIFEADYQDYSLEESFSNHYERITSHIAGLTV